MSAQLQAQPAGLHEGLSLLDDIVAKSKVAKTDTEHARAKDIMTALWPAMNVLESGKFVQKLK